VSQAFEKASSTGTQTRGRFENELALAKRLNLSRPTTRRAIQELVDKGMLVRKRGVRHPGGADSGASAGRTHQPVRRSRRAGQEAGNQGPRVPDRPGADDIAAHLNLPADSEVLTMRRLRQLGRATAGADDESSARRAGTRPG